MRVSTFLYSLVKVLHSALLNIFGIDSTDPKTRISSRTILGTTFRVPEKDRYSLFRALNYLLQTVLRTPVQKIDVPEEKELAFDVSSADRDLRVNYVKYFTKKGSIGYVDYNSLKVYPSFFYKLFCVSISCFLVPFLAFILLFIPRGKRAAFSLLLEEVIVLANLLGICRTKHVNTIYHFSIYEVFSNLFTQVLMTQSIMVVKIPSEVPLALWNKDLLASELVICNAYQYEEIKAYKENMIFDSTMFWGPELILDIKDLYKKQVQVAPEFTIGFYSTGGWLRKLLGHIDQGMKIEEQEMKVKHALRNYAKKKDISIGIFLHPREKKQEYLGKTKEHYQQLFEGIKYEFMPFDIPNNKLFEKVDLAVAFNTTIMYERLYCGFKCLFVPLELDNFPVKGSALRNICAYNETELEEKMEKFTSMSKNDYFRVNELETYSGINKLE
jgi:hypothetical protein